LATTFAELKAFWQAVSDWVTGVSASTPVVQNLPDHSNANAEVVSVVLAATINPAEHVVTADAAKSHELVITNEDEIVGMDVLFDGTLGVYSSTNMITLKPGQSRKFGFIPTTISYRTQAGEGNIRFTFGRNLDVTQGPNKSIFSEMKTIKYTVLAAARNENEIYAANGTALMRSTNRGETWSTLYTFGANVSVVFVTRLNSILVGLESNEIHRSDDDGATFTKVLDAVPWFKTQGIVQSRLTDDIVFGEYPTSDPGTNVRIFRSTDDGATWTAVKDFGAYNVNIRHVHSVQVDPFEATTTYIATTGDSDSQCQWWKSNDGDAAVWANMNVPATQFYRTLGVLFSKEKYFWATDAPGLNTGAYGVYSVLKTGVGDYANATCLRQTQGAVYGVTQINEFMLFGTVQEGTARYSRLCELVVSRDMGATWETALRWRAKDGAGIYGFYHFTPSSFEGDIYAPVTGLMGYSIAPNYYGTVRLTP
jgi:hypothetical protein